MMRKAELETTHMYASSRSPCPDQGRNSRFASAIRRCFLVCYPALAIASPLGFNEPEFSMVSYWPQPPAGRTLVIRFDSGRFGLYRRQADHFVLDDAWRRHTDPDAPSSLIWSGRWHYRIDPQEGVLEFQDDAPDRVSKPLSKGFELRWGKRLRVGQTIEHKVMFDGADAPFGLHHLTLTAHYDSYPVNGVSYQDVVRLDDKQVVCKDSVASRGNQHVAGPLDCSRTSSSWATYYLARSLGIIRIENAVLDGTPDFVPVESVVKWCIVRSTPEQEYCK